jgi:alkylation response protein AidB-like acyl-CoA dehydrogenase
MTDKNQANPSRFVEAARALAPAFAERAASHDASGRFVADNYTQLKVQKFFSAGVPSELGGGGASYPELCAMLLELGKHCGSTALSLSMHTHLLAAAVWRHKHGQPAEALLRKIAASEVVLVSTGAGDWLDSVGKSERVEGGYRVSAQKRFASGSPGGDLLLTSVPFEVPGQQAEVLHFAVSLREPGVSIRDDWDTHGMRGTGSNTVVLDNVFIPEAGITMRRPRGAWHPSYSVVCTVALPLVMSAYRGVGERAAELAREAARGRTPEPILLQTLGELENSLAMARMAHRELVENANDYDFDPTTDRANTALIRKTIAVNALIRTVDKAVELVGGGAFYRKNELERLSRDIQASHFHPLPEKKQLQLTGRVAMGLSPV